MIICVFFFKYTQTLTPYLINTGGSPNFVFMGATKLPEGMRKSRRYPGRASFLTESEREEQEVDKRMDMGLGLVSDAGEELESDMVEMIKAGRGDMGRQADPQAGGDAKAAGDAK